MMLSKSFHILLMIKCLEKIYSLYATSGKLVMQRKKKKPPCELQWSDCFRLFTGCLFKLRQFINGRSGSNLWLTDNMSM